jgi:DNA replication protein DnaC
MTISLISSRTMNKPMDDLTPVSVRGTCATHGIWSHEVPRISAEQARGQCPECTPALKPVRIDIEELAGTCETHGNWVNPVPSVLAARMKDRCPKCDQQAMDAKEQDQLKAQRTAVIGKRAAHLRKLVDGAEIPKRFIGRSFENYRLEEGNEPQAQALHRAQKFAANFPQAMELGANFVFCGKPGSGKTHLACSIGNAVMNNHGAAVLFITVFDVIQRVKATYGDKDQSERTVMRSFAEADLLILDEVGVQFGTDHEKVIITDLINRRYNDMRPTIILSNLDEAELGQFLGERVMDRMFEGGGGVIAFGWGSYRAKVARDKNLPRGDYHAPEWMQGE